MIKRQTLFRLWGAGFFFLLFAAGATYHMGQNTRAEIDQANLSLQAAYQELENVQRLSVATAELDKLTLNEKVTTRLEILRHLGFEQSNYKVDISSRQNQQVGATTLYLRTLTVTLSLPYAMALAVIDQIHNARKMVLGRITLKPSATDASLVETTLVGTIYGLEKN